MALTRRLNIQTIGIEVESPGINPHIYGQLIFNKDTKAIQWGKIFFLTNGISTLENNEVGPQPHTMYKN